MPMPTFFTVEQAAGELNVHPETLRRWLREKRIAGTRISVQAGWRIPATEVERILTETPDESPEALERRAQAERIARVERRLEAAARGKKKKGA